MWRAGVTDCEHRDGGTLKLGAQGTTDKAPAARHTHVTSRLVLPYMVAYMADTQKTTVYLDAADYRRLKAIAHARGCPPAQLVREAVARYAASETPTKTARSVGAARTGRKDLGERAEDLLAGFGQR